MRSGIGRGQLHPDLEKELDLYKEKRLKDLSRVLRITKALKKESAFHDYLWWASITVSLLVWVFVIAGVWPYWVGYMAVVWMGAGWLHSSSRTREVKAILEVLEEDLPDLNNSKNGED